MTTPKSITVARGTWHSHWSFLNDISIPDIQLPFQIIFQTASLSVVFYPSHAVSFQITQTVLCLTSHCISYLPFLDKHTSLYKHSFSFHVCLSALVCLKGFSKVCQRFLIACCVWFLFFSWAIILGETSTSSVSFKTVLDLWVCIQARREAYWVEQNLTDVFCQVPGKLHGKQGACLDRRAAPFIMGLTGQNG